jgi:CheY-like chemotaxis protein
LAEDKRINRELARNILTKAGHSVRCAENGAEAVEAWQGEQFDLVLMDLRMPGMDGIEATRRIRGAESQDPARRRTPIIAMTAQDLGHQPTTFARMGMDAYLPKPISAAGLLETMRRVTCEGPQLPLPADGSPEHETGAAAMEESAQPIESPTGPEAGVATESDSDDLQLEAALERIGDDRQLLATLAEEFLKDARRMSGQMQEALQARDCTTLRELAHSMKGAIGLFTMARPRRLSLELETAARDEDLEGAQLAMSEFQESLTVLCERLDQYVQETTPCAY